MILQSMHIGSMIGYTFHNAFSISDRGGPGKSMLFKVGKYSNYLCSLSTNLHCMTRRGPNMAHALPSFAMTSTCCMKQQYQSDTGKWLEILYGDEKAPLDYQVSA